MLAPRSRLGRRRPRCARKQPGPREEEIPGRLQTPAQSPLPEDGEEEERKKQATAPSRRQTSAVKESWDIHIQPFQRQRRQAANDANPVTVAQSLREPFSCLASWALLERSVATAGRSALGLWAISPVVTHGGARTRGYRRLRRAARLRTPHSRPARESGPASSASKDCSGLRLLGLRSSGCRKCTPR